MRKPNSNTAVRTPAHCTFLEPLGGRRYAYRNVWRKLVRAVPSGYHYRAVHVYGGFGTSHIGEWRLNHIHSVNNAEVTCINASLSVSSTEIDYR